MLDVRKSLIFKTYVFFINIIILLKTYVTYMSKAFVVKKVPQISQILIKQSDF